ncbi:glycoside hydrolase family 78 protein [Umezawaea endophytica]|uniref:alpha-L-rhamnosidase n=1 Tax=Umezawaea endophytica TaxID=1654476 RepID=A0A9X2VFT5_9PSEU|nr:glycoside hydrolase family 78 protein [Umezawaea endophytica]MCS7475790.1 glycoside hydrolase family 78 protein [Umezawaea endophytica]
MAGRLRGSWFRMVVVVGAVVLLPVSPAVGTSAGAAHLAVGALRVDRAVDPINVDTTTPALSWQVTSRDNGERQTAYRVLVASSPDLLRRGRPDVWDTGRVEGDGVVSVPYGGPEPRAGGRYFWTVQVWDSKGRRSALGDVARWETGLRGDWQGAGWITPDTADDKTWADFTLDVDFTVRAAAASVVFRAEDASNYYLWQVNATTTPGKVMLRPHVQVDGRFTTLGEVDLAPVVTPDTLYARHHLRVRAAGTTITTWVDGVQVDVRQDAAHARGTLGFRSSTSGGVPERARYDNLAVHDLAGAPLFSDDFSTDPDPLFPQTTVVDGQLEPTGDPTLVQRDPAAPMLRKDFTLDKPVASARAHVYGLGFHELRLNGGKVGDRVLTPASTPYDRRNLYETYDITSAVRSGPNAVGVWLGNGYGARYNPYGFRWLGPKQAIALIEVTFTDGSRRSVTTDGTWKWSSGAVLANDIYAGETHDARQDQPGWDAPGFDDSRWLPVRTASAPSNDLAPNTMPAMRVVDTLRPVALTEPRPGVFVYDLGQNIAGWARLRVKGPAGTAVRMRTAEELGRDGTLDVTTNRNAAATDTYVLAGREQGETYEPRFTYHGFRYVEVTGFPGRPTAESLDGRVVHADVRSTGTFESSSEMLDRIWRNNRWSVLNNSMSLPTDTPVRDERTPPAMDVQAYHEASVREFDLNSFYAKYLRDLPPGTALPSDAVKAQYPDMAGGQVTLAWTLFEQYGDRATLAETYPAMKAFVDRNAADVPSRIWPANQGFGDWCPPDHGPESNGGMGSPSAGDCFSEVSLVNTALSFQQAANVAKAADALGHPDDARRYTDLAESIRTAFNARFLSADGTTYGSGRQVTSVLPLAFGLVPAQNVRAVGERLVDTILTKDGGHLDTGIFGTRHLVDALARIGRVDVAMTVLHQETYPGFGFEIAHGATTSWEQWLYSSSMETHDHAMFAGVNASLYTVLGGIRPTAPGYRTVAIAPRVPAGLDHVSASLDTVRGPVSSTWRSTDREFTLTVTVPVTSTAVVEVPLRGGRQVRATTGAELVRVDGTTAHYEVGAGTWTFRVR